MRDERQASNHTEYEKAEICCVHVAHPAQSATCPA